MAPNSEVTLIIKTFKRRNVLRRLLDSVIKQGYEKLPILIADDSEEPYRKEILNEYGDLVDEYIVLPFDSGISKGRNELLRRVETDYFVLNDDDYVYGDITRIEKSVRNLKCLDLDIICGYYLNKNKKRYLNILPHKLSDYIGLFQNVWEEERWAAEIRETQDGGILIQPLPSSTSSIQHCDIGLNFFIARTEKVRDSVGGWTEELKTQEHWDFFYRCKKHGLDVAFSENFGVYHIQESNNGYDEYRHGRRDKMIRKALKINGFRYLRMGSRKVHVNN